MKLQKRQFNKSILDGIDKPTTPYIAGSIGGGIGASKIFMAFLIINGVLISAILIVMVAMALLQYFK